MTQSTTTHNIPSTDSTITTMPSQPLRIAIIGAGPAGSTLARILSQSSAAAHLSITVFEGETSLDVRAQGGTLDLRQGSGLDAIRAANLMPEFEKYARYDGESMIVSDKHFTRYLNMTGNAEDKNGRAPEIDRFRLRRLLLDSLPQGMIQWGKRLAEVREEKPSSDSAGRSYTLHFRDGTTAGPFSLVVGADGAWSKARPLLSPSTPSFSGVVGYSFTISSASKVCPETVALVNGGNIFSIHDQIFHSHQRMGDDTLDVSCKWVFESADPEWRQRLGHGSGSEINFEAARRYVLDQKLADWDPALRAALEQCSAENTRVAAWTLYELPVGHHWAHRAGVTLMGDAAHLMTPFAGEGVNQALTDAKVLAAEIVRAIGGATADGTLVGTALDAAVKAYETEMFERMAGKMELTRKMKEISLFMPGGLHANIEKWLLTAGTDELPVPSLTVPLATAAVYTYFYFFRWWKKPQH